MNSLLLEYLHRLLPESRSIVSSFYLTADSVLKAAKRAGLTCDMVMIENFLTLDLDDNAVAHRVFGGRHDFHRGEILIHTPACSRFILDDFKCQADDLMRFMASYDVEMLFDGDVIFLAMASRTITVFHHEGAFGHFRIPVHL